MLKHGEVNPLAVFGLRRLEHRPPHFVSMPFEARVSDKIITDWIYENLEGRFYLNDEYTVLEKHKLSQPSTQANKVVAFEIPGEVSMFALMLDTINQTQDW